MDIYPGKRKVIGLVEQAHTGYLCLPNFQRDFVWSREEVADLLRSIVRGYFVGSLLLLRCDPQKPPFAPIFLRGAKPVLAEPQPELLVLDGQQRLTALLYALTAPNLNLKDSSQQRWFFVDLNLLMSKPFDDEIVFDRSSKDLNGLEHVETQYTERKLPCTRLLTSDGFLQWRDGLDDWLAANQPDEHKQFRSEWRGKWTQAITDFQNFEVPVVELPRVDDSDDRSIGRVCAIFEKLNSTGVELSVYDLLTARLYPNHINLHHLWDEACKKHKRLAEWSGGKAENYKFGVMILRIMGLLRNLEVGPSSLIKLAPQNFEKDWRRGAAAMERALELVTLVGPDGFGVFDRKWLPGFGLLPVLAALRTQIEDRKLGAGPREDLRRWYWSNLFLERYSSAVESKSKKDYAELLAYWTQGGSEPAIFVDARARIGASTFSIRDSASYASTVYSGAFCLLALRGARDWKFGENLQLQALQDHHIFPQAYLRDRGITDRAAVNSIVNRTLISDITNNQIKAKAPADYLADPGIFPAGPTPDLTEPHFQSAETIEAMRQGQQITTKSEIPDIYEAFRSARERALISEIRRVCGVPEPGAIAPAKLVDLPTQSGMTAAPALGFTAQRVEPAAAETPTDPAATTIPTDVPDPDDADAADEGLAPRHFMRREFWQAFMQRAARRAPLPARLGKGIGSWISVPTGKKQLYWDYLIRMHDSGLDLSIYRQDAAENKRLFDTLFERKEEIERVFGGPLEWDRYNQGRGSFIRYRLVGGGLLARESWLEIQDRMIETIVRFQKALEPAIQELPD